MLLIILVALVLVGLAFALPGLSGTIWVPTRRQDLKELLDSLGTGADRKAIELGCGDGRVVRALARAGWRVRGVELNPILAVIAWMRNIGAGRASVRCADMWRQDLSDYDLIFVFQIPSAMDRLSEKIRGEAKPGAMVASYQFEIPGLGKAVHRHNFYLYEPKS